MEDRVATGSGLEAEAVGLLGELISIDTQNPPGNEAPAQELLAARLGDAGFECELLAAREGRPNLIARLSGRRPGPRLAILGHSDTVPADPGEWSFGPWAGDLVDGEVRGRGAQDMKGQVAAEVAGCAALAQEGWRPDAGELLVVITADEEAGGVAGAKWLCEAHPEKVRCEMVVNEGAGIAIEHAGRRLYTLSVGEKGIFRFAAQVRGTPGHASLPGIGDNAMVKLAPLLERLRDQPPPEPGPEALTLLAALGADVADAAHAGSVLGPQTDPRSVHEAVEQVRREHPAETAFLIEPMLGPTLVPTGATGSAKENVTPSRAELLVDCRVPPEMTEPEVRERVRAVLGPGDYEISFRERVIGSRSPADTELFDTIADWISGAEPGAVLVPVVMAGFSDSHWFRRAFGATAYGFSPQRQMSVGEAGPLVHGIDERIRAADVGFAASFFAELPRAVLG